MTEKLVKIEDSWYIQLQEEFSADYFQNLKQFLVAEKAAHTVYPPGSQLFNAFNFTPFNKVKVVILGQDPYHGPGQAHGLCFSVPIGIKPPPSLANIYKELNSDIGFKIPKHGNLEQWAEQGVFLLNATLTVRANSAGSHQNKGWEIFTNKVISILSQRCENLVFVLWGRYATAKESLIDNSKHCILKAAHPSPLSAYNGFIGCKHFSKINEYLLSVSKTPIDWTIKPALPQLF
jgi:uracil-DNA glycosylase